MQVDVGGAFEAIEVPLVAPGSRVLTPDVQLPLGLTFEGMCDTTHLHWRPGVLRVCILWLCWSCATCSLSSLVSESCKRERARTSGRPLALCAPPSCYLVLLMP